MNTTETSRTTIAARSGRERLIHAWATEMHLAREASRRHESDAEWGHLERAHILSQPLAGRHVRTHLAMLGFGLRACNRREVVGQMFRTVVAAPGSWSGRYPTGNTGGANVSAFAAMPVPADLQFMI
ncbi:MAG: DUF3703 domain-containing protein [Ilumatobacteraceae bacterium]